MRSTSDRSPHRAVQPPSTASVCPVINEADGDARNATAAATFAVVPIRWIAAILSITSARNFASLSASAVPSVSTNVGATALTRIPCTPHSTARARDLYYCRFRDRIGQLSGECDEPGLRRDVDDRTTSGRGEETRSMLGEEEGRPGIQGPDGIKILFAHVECCVRDSAPGVVDENIETAEQLRHLVQRGTALREIGHVHGEGDGCAAERPDLGHDAAIVSEITNPDSDIRASSREFERDLPPDPTCRAGDDGTEPGEITRATHG